MRFLKEKKGIIISFIIGVILASSITVYAYSYYAKDIGYTKPGTTTEISVETALNELYGKISNETTRKRNKLEFGRKNHNIRFYEFDRDWLCT